MLIQNKKLKKARAFSIFLVVILGISVWKIDKIERVSAADITYSGKLSSPRESYDLTVGDFVIDGSNIWTIGEAEEIAGLGGLICTWTHDSKSEILADYQPVKYPGYKHFSMDEAVFGAGYVIIIGQQNTIYSSYNDFRNEVGKLYKSVGASGFKAYNIYYAKKEGRTSFVYQNGNLKLEIPVTISAQKEITIPEYQPAQSTDPPAVNPHAGLDATISQEAGITVSGAKDNQHETVTETVTQKMIENGNITVNDDFGMDKTKSTISVLEKDDHIEQAGEAESIQESEKTAEDSKKAILLTGVVLVCSGVVLFARRKF